MPHLVSPISAGSAIPQSGTARSGADNRVNPSPRVAGCCLPLSGLDRESKAPNCLSLLMPPIRNQGKRKGVSLDSGDPLTALDDASCSGGDGGTCPLAPPRAREPTNEGFAGPGRRPKDPCPPFAGVRIGVSVFPAAWRTQTLDRLLGPGNRQ